MVIDYQFSESRFRKKRQEEISVIPSLETVSPPLYYKLIGIELPQHDTIHRAP